MGIFETKKYLQTSLGSDKLCVLLEQDRIKYATYEYRLGGGKPNAFKPHATSFLFYNSFVPEFTCEDSERENTVLLRFKLRKWVKILMSVIYAFCVLLQIFSIYDMILNKYFSLIGFSPVVLLLLLVGMTVLLLKIGANIIYKRINYKINKGE